MSISIYSLTLKQLKELFIQNNIKPYVADQIYDWIYHKNIKSFEACTNVSKENINKLKELFFFEEITIDKLQVDKNDGTVKFLLKLADNNFIETVIMKFNYGYSVCVTSQIGCNMACKFCASGLIRKKRNITVGEFIKQFLIAKEYVEVNFKSNLSHMVVMGIGEPFDNFENLIQFFEVIKQQKGLCISPRKITVSTCGLVEKIKEFADLKNQVNLAISLHAPNNEIRNKIMPINKVYPIEKLIDALDYYIYVTKRRVTIEYILIKDVNDSDANAEELAKLLKGKLCYVNLIPYNKVVENNYFRSTRAKQFFDVLKQNGIQATVRLERGSSIDAACGQLRIKKIMEQKNAKV
ncbi:MAG: 23S rRNA (adenine(2503)-C(2))-methyltransferase RlmN [Malacoplasma sp.]|nr:23S rRNA (adenine(2503)-C(2))-methyltransferase RlmN [Malacoplasma sp.]